MLCYISMAIQKIRRRQSIYRKLQSHPSDYSDIKSKKTYKAIQDNQQGNTRQYKTIQDNQQGNTRQYKTIQGNTRQYKAIQGNGVIYYLL